MGFLYGTNTNSKLRIKHISKVKRMEYLYQYKKTYCIRNFNVFAQRKRKLAYLSNPFTMIKLEKISKKQYQHSTEGSGIN